MNGERDVVILSGARTPFVKSGTELAGVSAVDLGRVAMREAIERAEIDPDWIDEVVVGNIAGPADAANIARVIALSAKVPRHVPAFTVNRNCASGLEAVVEAAYRIRSGDADLMVAGATESMSQIPLLFRPESQAVFTRMARAKGPLAKLGAAAQFRPRHFSPLVGLMLGLTDPVSGLNMGQTAEVLAREFGITREEQDRFALASHQRTAAAWKAGRMDHEVVPVPLPPKYTTAAQRDNGVRENQTMEALAKLRPVFDRKHGTVTPGNSSQITDGAAALVLASARRARELGLQPIGRLLAWGFAGCDPARMGLGPVLATPIALRRAGNLPLERIDLVEINEAFAAQVLACLRAFESRDFFEKHLGSAPIGAPDPDKLNVNGGAIAMGHPVGATGGRLVLTLLEEMARRDASLGLATLCVGGGQGGALVLERS
ncbi:MAG: acetyl-CoA C-acyltransferase [Acidobacteria bacterium]|nr:acetyl-CoA C-acyltransferase [Acidobacteriota bacterium]NIM60241.1 acetyl-CoA C-acyltransferase [Acidobacteriota bacterium]NIO60279.1 acetyl-CoA C-acyltransferase [Acidobacteriota bacterium]NIQ31334.1 acetyl-CoA C-acyltransferase [Acidobacteriota bacterium]NIQ86557.1 acetyl-CoA C-acyltransferase [Acidobacteriota bacterium]